MLQIVHAICKVLSESNIGTGIIGSMANEKYSRNLVRIARNRAGLTQAQLALLASTSQAAISAYESGRRSPSVDTLSRILQAAGFELRMRIAPPDSHDAARHTAEQLLPEGQVDAFTKQELTRTKRHRQNPSGRRRG